MSKISDDLHCLREEVYAAEGSIDGSYNTQDPTRAEFTEVNRLYDETLAKMRELLAALDTTIEILDINNFKIDS